MNELKSLSDEQLFGDLKKFSGKEQEACVPVLLYLIEVEDRRLFAEEGYSSAIPGMGFSEPTPLANEVALEKGESGKKLTYEENLRINSLPNSFSAISRLC